jgi:hypothetical protein
MHAALCAAGKADEAFRMRADRCQRDGGGDRIAQMLTRARMGNAQQTAQIAPASFIGDEQREVTPVVEAQLAAMDRAKAEAAGRLGELHRAPDTVVIGQRESAIAKFERRNGKLFWERGAVEKRIGGMAMQLGVHGAASSPLA